MTHSTVDTSGTREVHQATCRSQRATFFPCQPISLPMAGWSLLLGFGLTCPAFLFLALFPVSAQTPRNHLQVALFPGVAIALHVLLGPLLEEVVYRGLFLQLARRYLPVWVAIAVSSAVFAITHLPKSPGTVVLAFPIACLYAWMVVRSGSLYPGLLCHSMFNFAAMFIVFPLFGIGKKILALPPNTRLILTEIFPAWWIVLSLLVTLASFIMLAEEFARGQQVTDRVAGLAADVT
jgi:membrane protease YdiL (CAAX protease family)